MNTSDKAKIKKARKSPVVKEISLLVKSLSGIVDLPAGYDRKIDYTNYLVKKYK